MTKHRKHFKKRLTYQGKIFFAVFGAAMVLVLSLLILTSLGFYESINSQIGRLVSTQPTISIYASAKDKIPFTYTTSDAAYGSDVAIISKKFHRYEIMLSGQRGWVDSENIELINQEEPFYASYYTINENDELVHAITQNLTQQSYQFIRLDTALPYLSKGVAYYSYDGHYFYDDEKVMLQDYRERSNASAVNKTPYYNYYQYMPMKSHSNVNAEVMDQFLVEQVQATPSVLWYHAQDFIDIQSEQKVNALLLYSLAINESAFGTSYLALNKYNLFGYNAVDVDPNLADPFESVVNCLLIYTRDHLNNGYFNELDTRYHGAYLGDKAGGMNVSYASDPYWGEKAAGFAYQLDARANFVDKGNYTLAIGSIT